MAHHSRIDDNLKKLSTLSSIGLQFLTDCFEKKIINREEYDKLKSYGEGFERNVVFYQYLYQKDEDAFKKLLEIIELSDTRQSDDVLKILKGTTTQVAYSEKLPRPSRALRHSDVHWIVNRYFIEDPIMIQKKEIFYSALGLRLSGLHDLTRTERYESASYSFLAACLSMWISSYGRDANFTKLDEALRSIELNLVADNLSEDPDAQ